MWYAGELATCFRQNFVKYYNLGERVFPAHLQGGYGDEEQVNWLCNQALDRLTFGTGGEIHRFWEAMTAKEAQTWRAGSQDLVPIEVQGADGRYTAAWGTPDIEDRLAQAPDPTIRLRILNPFDPSIRDRMRLQRLFGFEYRNEMFVPAAKRRWGYYIYPVLEGDRFVGRLELKADRSKGWMRVTGFWPEQRVKWGSARYDKLAAELARFARFAGIEKVSWDLHGQDHPPT